MYNTHLIFLAEIIYGLDLSCQEDFTALCLSPFISDLGLSPMVREGYTKNKLSDNGKYPRWNGVYSKVFVYEWVDDTKNLCPHFE